ncbi:beta strand repeat-containing protein [Streptomyces sp. NPDC059850]|uniref:beta strand repeat-containing protein n=1 Tax=Streptomyces sp. NPDC059850 TaxID=3346970 RepID=UPI00366271C2
MASSTTTVTSTPNPSVPGQTVTYTATVASVPPGAFTPTGTVTFTLDAGAPVTVAVDASGQAVFTDSTLAVGSHTVTATYSGDANLDPSTGTSIQQVNQGATTTSLTVSPNPAVCGEAVTLTASVAAVPPAAGIPTGTVTFIISADGPALTVALDATGQASVTVADLDVGVHLVAAFYGGDTEFSASNSPLVPLTVAQASSTTVVTADPDPSVCGQSVTLCATVTVDAPGTCTPTGTVTFTVTGGPTLTAPLDATGQACVTSDELPGGTSTVTATYSGDTGVAGSSGTTTVTVNQATSAVSLSVTPSPSVCGEAVTICAQVSVGAPSTCVATGDVTFVITGGPTLTATLDATGQACVTTTAIPVGSQTVTATYAGNAGVAGSAATASVTVNQAASTTTVTSPDPGACGEAVLLCAQVTTVPPGTCAPTGTVTFVVTGGPTLTATVDATGQACVSTTALPVGTHVVTATYSGDTGVAGSTGTGTVTVNQGTSTLTVAATPSPSVCGETVTICAQVTVDPPSTCVPTGDVTFVISGGPTLTATLDATGQACVTTTAVPVGTSTITGTYAGDSGVGGSTGTTSITVNPASSTTTVSATPDPSVCGETVLLCAQVTTVPPGTCVPTGTVTFTVSGGGPTLTATVDATGQACVSTTAIPTGTHTVTATFGGGGGVAPSTGSGSVTVNQASSTTTVTVSPTPAVCGQPVTICAQVTATAPGTCTPTGTVTFVISGGPTLTGTLNASGQACVTTSALGVGSHTVTATYGGSTGVAGSTGTATATVNTASTTTTLTSAPNPSAPGQTVTFTATVAPVAPATGTPTGTVTFVISGGPTLTGTLNGAGQATVSTNALTAGSHTVTATYSGDTCYASSTASLTQTVSGSASTTMTATPAVIRLRLNGQLIIPTLSATLKDQSNNPVPGQTIVFTANSAVGPIALGAAVTNASGTATLTNVTVPAAVLTAATYTATFAGAPGLSPATASATLTFQPLPLLP